jgi:hypothetical protein
MGVRHQPKSAFGFLGNRCTTSSEIAVRLTPKWLFVFARTTHWAEGRNNPVWFECSSWLGVWVTEDRITWQTTNGTWLAQLERSANGWHYWMAFYHHGTYMGRQDASGFDQPARQGRGRRPRPAARSLPLPLAG